MKYSIASEVITSTFKISRSLRPLSSGHLDLERWYILALIEGGYRQPSDLAAELKVKRPTISAILNDLESRGLLSRRKSEIDRRQVLLTVTRRGRKALEKSQKYDTARVERLLSDLQPAEVTQLAAILHKLSDYLE